MARAGAVWVDVLPNMSRFGRELGRQVSEPVIVASRQAGEDGGEAAADGLGSKLKAGALAAGLAAGGALTMGLTEAMEGEKATSKLKAQLGLTGKDAQRAGKAAGNLYSNAVTESVEDGAAAVGAIMSAGIAPAGATTRQLQTIATKVADVSNLFETDLGQTANAVGQMLKTGLAKDGAEALDTITRGFQVMGPRADDLMDTFNEYSVIFSRLGLSAKLATGLISQGMKAGARDTDTVADALKEFQIRATDGSKGSADGFKALGLNASDMTARIAKGGKSAESGLGLVLDKLRDTKDPVKRNAAAVALFGTKAEDLGKALFALDTDTATGELGKVSGAAKKAGDDLRDNTATQIEQFKRGALHGLSTVLAQDVIPAIKSVAPVVGSALTPVAALWRWLNEDPARMKAAAIALLAIGGAIATFKIAGAVVGGVTRLVGGIRTAGTLARTAGTNIRFAAFAARYYATIGAASAKTAVVAGARWAAAAARSGAVWVGARARAVASFAGTAASAAANAARTAVTWTTAAVRSGVGWAAARARAAGSFVAMAASATVNATRTAAAWVGAQTRSALATGRATLALAAQRVAMVGTAIATRAMAAGQWILNAALRANPIGLIITGLVALGAGLVLAYKKSSTFRAIVQGAMRGVMVAVRAVGSAAMWLWHNAIRPALSLAMAHIRVFGRVAMWLYRNAVQPAMRGVGAAVSWVYREGIKPWLDKGKNLVKNFGTAFKLAKDYIARKWGELRSATRKPVQFVIDTVYNNGIRAVWNKVSGAFGGPTLKRLAFAKGGVMPGYTPGRDVHEFSSPTGGRLALSGGEAFMVPEWTRAVGGPRAVAAMNSAARRGGSGALGGAMSGGGVQHFADGGVWGWIKSAGTAIKGAGSAAWDMVRKGASWLKDGVKASAMAGMNKLVKPLLSKISGSKSLYRDMITRIPKKIMSTIFDFAGKADTKLAAAGVMGGKGTRAALSWARRQAGKPYLWGGVGPRGFDCSGFMGAIQNVITGSRPFRRMWATMAFPPGASGWQRNLRAPFQVGITNRGVGHTAGTLNGTNVESRGGDGVVVGSRARGARSGMFTSRWGYRPSLKYDGGGLLPPGVSTVVNRTRKPEPVLTGPQFDVLESSARVGAALVAASADLPRAVEGLRTVIPGSVRPAGATAAAATAEGLPRTVVFRVGEREFVAYLDELIDEGLEDVRRRKRAGSRG